MPEELTPDEKFYFDYFRTKVEIATQQYQGFAQALVAKYGLTEGDDITTEGKLVRKPKE